MKSFYILVIFSCFISFAATTPVPGVSNDGHSQSKGKGKGKGRAQSEPPSRPDTPTSEHDISVPLPGRTGIYTDHKEGIVTMYYGDDILPEHMGHLQRNQAAFPHNRNPMSLATINDRNRRNALRKVPKATLQPGTKDRRVRDEKMLAMFHNPNHDTSTTVEYLPIKESSLEGSHAKDLKEMIKQAGPTAQGQLRPNPGWLSLHPDQQRGHEAPAQLNSQTFKDPKGKGRVAKRKGKKVQKPKNEGGSKKGYTPTSGQMTLRPRPNRDAPPRPTPLRGKKAAKKSGNNLRPGRVLPAGHVWTPSDGSDTASHVGAPGHLQGAEERYPPRPQNHGHYMQQLQAQKSKAADNKEAASGSRPAKDMSMHLPKQSDNLDKFNAKFGPGKLGNGVGKANEAPARMETHLPPSLPPKRTSSRQPPLNRPASGPSSTSRVPNPNPVPQNHKSGSNSKAGPSKSKPGPSNSKPGPSNPKPGPSNNKPGPSSSKPGSSTKRRS